MPFVGECDASDLGVSAVLNKGRRPVALMSRTLQGSEVHYPAVEKEAMKIIEAVWKWSNFLTRKHFTLISDQCSVAFILNNRKRTNIKKSKIREWRIELSSFSYTIKYRPGKDTVTPDTFTHSSCCSTLSSSTLADIHNLLCHPGVTRLLHFVRSTNLPFSTEEVKKICANWKIWCAWATQGTSRGPISSSNNPYTLTVVDEYSRFPFAFPCQNRHKKLYVNVLTPHLFYVGCQILLIPIMEHPLCLKNWRNTLLEKVWRPKELPFVILLGMVSVNATMALSGNPLSWSRNLVMQLNNIGSLPCQLLSIQSDNSFFGFQRWWTHGNSLPSWLMSPSPVLLWRFVSSARMIHW